jgi:opacity protein-like surface antigen
MPISATNETGIAWFLIERRAKPGDHAGAWAAGAAVKYGISPNWTVRAEHPYLDLGSVSSVFPLANRQQISSAQYEHCADRREL